MIQEDLISTVKNQAVEATNCRDFGLFAALGVAASLSKVNQVEKAQEIVEKYIQINGRCEKTDKFLKKLASLKHFKES